MIDFGFLAQEEPPPEDQKITPAKRAAGAAVLSFGSWLVGFLMGGVAMVGLQTYLDDEAERRDER